MYEKEVVERLREMYSQGMTYKEMKERTGISISVIAHAINGSRLPKNLSVDTLMKVFPGAVVSLGGSANNNSGGMNVGAVNGSNNFFNQDKSCAEKIRAKLLNDDSFSADEKIKFLKFLENV
ncbi:MAG: helix-turn-helix transcriptional regulator [Lentisphaeria bacterium]|nr:helix-turn-helix transcriptional regulator [Lentisphaeria bacterium]MBR7119937.1 helix-turn-helix transcriptional regulator [Lentisphaeria bacterium]